MSVKTFTMTLAAAVVMAACSTRTVAPSGVTPQASWAQQIQQTRDDYKKITVVVGGDIEQKRNTIILRSTRSDSFRSEDGIVVYVVARMSEWKFLDTTYSIDGKTWKTSVVDRDVRSCSRYGCSLAEHLAVFVDRNYLMAHTETGIDFKITGKRGEETVYIPGKYIAAFLDRLPTKSP